MAKLERRNGIWYARFKNSQGSWKYKSCGKGTTKSEAIILASRWEDEALHNNSLKTDEEALHSLFSFFNDEHLLIGKKGLYKASGTVKRERNAINNFINYVNLKNVTKIEQITTQFIIHFLLYRKKEHSVSPKTLWEERRVIRNFFEYVLLSKSTNISLNPADLVPTPTLTNTRTRFFTHEELEAIFKSACETYKPIFKFLYLTGLRSGELCNLRWRDFYPKENKLVIRGSQDTRYLGNKYRHDTEIPISPKVLEVLHSRRGIHKEFIFTNTLNNQLRKNQIYKILWTILKNNGIKNACVHTFRHSTASHLVIKGISIYKVSKYLRHSSVKMTEIYAHLSPDNLVNDISVL